MSDTPITDGLNALEAGQGPDQLYAACSHLPRYEDPAPDPQSDDDRGPISPGESFDDVTAAWTAGKLTDQQYDQCLARAGRPARA